jgi:hypothetical protein
MLVATLALACGGDGEGAGPDETETLSPAPSDGGGDGGQTSAPPEQEDAVTDDPEDFARADAAQRAGVDEAEVTVVTNEAVTWPNGALGCPQPGQFYTQALVEGYRIVVEAGGQEFHYHGETGRPPAYCENPSEPAAGDGGVVDR